ncbi:MAG TPA: hypothetical protein VMU30_10935 [Bacteroidota bacterium]|nr:hypothetical protein [Bacteroidota bacterium]
MSKVRIIIAAIMCSCVAFTATAQINQAAASMMGQKDGGSLPVGFGATFIDGQTFYLISVMPDLSFGRLGIGLDINLRINSQTGALRPGDYAKFSDYLRILRYVRWAQKGDPFYVRFGQLDYSLLGHGSIIYNYNNSASYDLRKSGIELDVNSEKAGFESMYSDVTDKGLLGMRGYVRPLKFTSLAKVPVINNFEVGATYARDLSDNATSKRDSVSPTNIYYEGTGGLSIYGFDLGLPILQYPVIKSSLYFDYAKIVNYGNGTSVGINLGLNLGSLVVVKSKYEYRFNGDEYIPAYFNALYEYDRFSTARGSKSDTLNGIKANKGYYGELLISVLNTINIIGAYQAPAPNDNQGVMHAELRLPDMAGIVVRGAFDKTDIGRVFVPEHTILSAELGYMPVKYLLVSMLFQRTFSDRDANGNPLGYFVKQDRVEPKVSVVFDF